jgi:hypothetical protein
MMDVTADEAVVDCAVDGIKRDLDERDPASFSPDDM